MFVAIRDDEMDHVKTMAARQQPDSSTYSKVPMFQPLLLNRYMPEATTLLQNYKHGQRNFAGISLANANLSHADLKGADLSYSELNTVDLSQANLRGADLSYAKLSKVDLRGADLRGAMLIGTDLRDVSLQNTNLQAADYIPGTTLFPQEFDPQEAGMSPVQTVSR